MAGQGNLAWNVHLVALSMVARSRLGREAAMIPLLTADEMTALELRSIHSWGISSLVLQETAALGALQFLPEEEGLVHILAGPGNNGGDALALARLLKLQGRDVEVWTMAKEPVWRGDAEIQARLWEGIEGSFHFTEHPLDVAPHWRGWVVDGIFGLGSRRSLAGVPAEWAAVLNASDRPVLALDLPSGLDPSSPDVPGPVIRATRTACFGAYKRCHGLRPSKDWCGEISLIPIPLRDRAQSGLMVMERPVLPARPWNAHKHAFGHVGIRAGSLGMSGAAVLAAIGALRVGAGLVSILADSEVRGEIAGQIPEAMVRTWEGAVPDFVTVLLVGPGGLGEIPSWNGPMVLDAAALQEGEGPRWMQRPDTAVTPHPGEFGRLFGLPKANTVSERIAQVEAVSSGPGILLLKGAQSLVAGGDSPEVWINPKGHVGLATGGTGDLLAGMVAGLRAQGLPMRESVATASWLHGEAADRLGAGPLIPRDLAQELAQMLRDLSRI